VCGASRESINKCLGLWQRRGIVPVEERLITVADRTALEELAKEVKLPTVSDSRPRMWCARSATDPIPIANWNHDAIRIRSAGGRSQMLPR
jgi:hypothetical protein